LPEDDVRQRSPWEMLFFFTIVSVFTSVICGFIGVVLSYIYTPDSTLSIWYILGGIGFGISLFVLQLVTHMNHSKKMMIFYLFGSLGLAVFFYMFIISLFIGFYVILLAIMGIPFHDSYYPILVRIFIPAVLAIFMVWGIINARHLKRRRIELEMMQRGNKPAKVIIMSDIHLGLLVGKTRLDAILRTLREEKPDIIVIAGDLLDTSPRFLKRFESFLNEIVTIAPTYCVMGNHEFYNGMKESMEWLSGLGLRVLENEIVEDKGTGMNVIGVHDPSAFGSVEQYRKEILELVRSSIGPASTILINHQPLHFREAAGIRPILQLSGHTHAGQIWPFSLATRAVFKEGDRGLHRWKGSFLYVCTGTGTWGPPMRVGTSSEMVIIDIK
jgi:hypothetical protein